MSSIYYGKPAMKKVRHVYGARLPHYEACIHIDGKTGQECGQPTEGGAQRCKACSDRLRMMASGRRYPSFKNVLF